MQTGIAGLNDIMIGDIEIEKLTEDTIEFLATYTGSNVGALYIKETSEHLKLYSGYAYSANEKRSI